MYFNVPHDLLGGSAWVSAHWNWTDGETDFIILSFFDVLGLLFAAGGGTFVTSLAVTLLFLALSVDVVVADNLAVQSFDWVALGLLGFVLPFLGWTLGRFIDDGVGSGEFAWVFKDAVLWGHEVGFFLSIKSTAQTKNISAEFIAVGGQLDAFSIVEDVEVFVKFSLDFTVWQSVDLDETIFNVETVFIIEFGWFLVDENLSLLFAGMFWDHVDFPEVLFVVHNDFDFLLVATWFTDQDDVVVISFALEARFLVMTALLLLFSVVDEIVHHDVPGLAEVDWIGGVIEGVGSSLVNDTGCYKERPIEIKFY